MNQELTVRTAQQHAQEYVPRLLEHVARGELDPSHLATHRFSLEAAPRGDEFFNHKEDGCVRVVFMPQRWAPRASPRYRNLHGLRGAGTPAGPTTSRSAAAPVAKA